MVAIDCCCHQFTAFAKFCLPKQSICADLPTVNLFLNNLKRFVLTFRFSPRPSREAQEMKWCVILLLQLILQFHHNVESIGITASIAAVAAAIGGGYLSKDTLMCYYECCHDRSSNKWINYEPAFTELERKLFGQHIAVELVKRSIRQHLKNDKPPKALVLSFHGYTGVGKNYLSKLVARAIYRQYGNDETSKFVHTLVATHFLSENANADRYRLKTMIENGISNCERSLFIIDEVDKFPEKFLDFLIPYIESNNKFNGANFNKAIFLLLG